MEENNFNNEVSVEDILAPEIQEAPVVEAPMPETKVEEVALENNIEASVSEVKEAMDVITTSDLSKSSVQEVQALGSVANGIIGAVSVPKTENKSSSKPASKKKSKTVAIYSTKNVSWGGVGKVQRGYNIVTQEEADKWSTRDHIRIATPEEVAREFGR